MARPVFSGEQPPLCDYVIKKMPLPARQVNSFSIYGLVCIEISCIYIKGKRAMKKDICLLFILLLCVSAYSQSVNGDLIQFNDDGIRMSKYIRKNICLFPK